MSLTGLPRTNWIVDTTRKITREWDQWLQSVVAAVNASAQQIGHASVNAMTSATAPTNVPMPPLAAGLYRLSYTARVLRAATISSSLTVTLGWTMNAVSVTESGAALTGNTTSTQQSAVWVAQVDASTPVTYAVAYSSTGATTMRYAVDVLVEALP